MFRVCFYDSFYELNELLFFQLPASLWHVGLNQIFLAHQYCLLDLDVIAQALYNQRVSGCYYWWYTSPLVSMGPNVHDLQCKFSTRSLREHSNWFVYPFRYIRSAVRYHISGNALTTLFEVQGPSLVVGWFIGLVCGIFDVSIRRRQVYALCLWCRFKLMFWRCVLSGRRIHDYTRGVLPYSRRLLSVHLVRSIVIFIASV